MARLVALEGVEVEARHAFVGGLRVGYLEAGSGEPVVLLHGGTGGGANWYRLMGPLSARFRVLAPDLPGFGRSDPMELEGELGRTAAAAIGRWMGALDLQRAHVIGTSFGGLVAVRLAQIAPERVGRLVLIGSAGLGGSLPWIVRMSTVPVLGRVLTRPSRAGSAWQVRRLMTAGRGSLPDGHAEALADYLWESARTAEPGWLARVLRGFAGAAGQRELLSDEDLAGLSPPTLVVWGGRDRFLPVAHGRRAASLIPDARLCVIDAAGHSPNWETPEELLSCLLPFLEEASAAT